MMTLEKRKAGIEMVIEVGQEIGLRKDFMKTLAKDLGNDETLMELVKRGKEVPLDDLKVRRNGGWKLIQVAKAMLVAAWRIKKELEASQKIKVTQIYEVLKEKLPELTKNMAVEKREWLKQVFEEKKVTLVSYLRGLLKEIEEGEEVQDLGSRSSRKEKNSRVEFSRVEEKPKVVEEEQKVAEEEPKVIKRKGIKELKEQLIEGNREKYPHLRNVLESYPELAEDLVAGKKHINDEEVQNILTKELRHYVHDHPLVRNNIEKYPLLPEVLFYKPELIIALEEKKLSLQSPEMKEEFKREAERQRKRLEQEKGMYF